MDKKKTAFKVSKRPAGLLDLINAYFPPDLAAKWGKLSSIEKWLNAVTSWPERTDSRYKDRCNVHQAAVELHQKYPKLRAPKIAEHPKVRDAGGKNYSQRKVTEWVREVVKFPPGAPKKE